MKKETNDEIIEEGDYDLPKLICKRCLHNWIPRTDDLPIVCPNCKSPYWNIKKIRVDKK